jgi:lysophospholipase L1-like esterase
MRRHAQFLLIALCCAGLLPATLHGGDAKPQRTAESAVTPVNRNPKRHEQFMQRISAGPVGLLFLGDSITDMWPYSSNTWNRFKAYQVANFGVSGERTEDVLWRIGNGELDGIDPKAVVILIGTNNLARSEEQPEWVAAGIKAIITTVQQKLPHARILLMAIFPRGQSATDPMRARIAAVNTLITAFAEPGRVDVLDIGDRLVDAQGGIAKEIMPDFLHPSGKGFKIWYEAMWPTLSKLLE